MNFFIYQMICLSFSSLFLEENVLKSLTQFYFPIWKISARQHQRSAMK